MKKNLLINKMWLLVLLSILFNSCESNEPDDEKTTENYTLKINSNEEQGEVVINPVKASYEFGEEVHVKAIPKEEYVFSGWEGTVTGHGDLIILFEKNHEITAVFEKNDADNSGGDNIKEEHIMGTGPITLVMSVEHNLLNPVTIIYNDGSGEQRTSNSEQLIAWSRTIKISRDFDFLIEVSGTASIGGNFTIKIDAFEGDKSVYTYDKTYPTGSNSSFKASVKDIVFSD